MRFAEKRIRLRTLGYLQPGKEKVHVQVYGSLTIYLVTGKYKVDKIIVIYKIIAYIHSFIFILTVSYSKLICTYLYHNNKPYYVFNVNTYLQIE